MKFIHKVVAIEASNDNVFDLGHHVSNKAAVVENLHDKHDEPVAAFNGKGRKVQLEVFKGQCTNVGGGVIDNGLVHSLDKLSVSAKVKDFGRKCGLFNAGNQEL